MSSNSIRGCLGCLIFTVVAVVAATTPAAEPLIEEIGAHTATVRTERWTLRVSAVRDDILRLHAAPAGALPPRDERYEAEGGPLYVAWPIGSESGRLEVRREHDRIELRTKRLELLLGVNGVAFQLADRQGKVLLASSGPQPWLSVTERGAKACFALGPKEHLMGGGGRRSRVSPLDKRESKLEFASSELGETGTGGGHGVPMLFSSAGYGVFLDNVWGGAAELKAEQAKDDPVSVQFEAGKNGQLTVSCPTRPRCSHDFDLYLYAGPGMAQMAEAHRHVVGAPLLPERWFYGLLMSKYSWGSPEAIAQAAERFDELDFPIDAFIEDYAWRGGKAAPLTWAKNYQNGKAAMFEELKRRQIRLGLHLNKSNKYDVTNSEQRAETLRDYQALLADGVSFWWHDHAETGYRTSLPGNTFGSLWAAAIVRHMFAQGHSVPVVSRGGAVGGHRSIAPWPGDVGIGMKNMIVDLDFVRDAGLAGYAAPGVDQGGFGGPGDDENMIRRVAHTTLFFPMIRPHGSPSKPPWTVSKEVQDLWRFYLKLRYRLHPYIYSAAIECSQTMRPVTAPLAFDFPNDDQAWAQDYHFLLGRDLLVVPVTQTNVTTVGVYLPAGEWLNYWTGARQRGPATITVPSKLSDRNGLALFLREGAMVPYGEPGNRTPERASARIELEIVPPAAAGTAERSWLETDHPLHAVQRIVLRQERKSDGSLAFSLDPHPYGGRYRLLVHGNRPQSVEHAGRPLLAKGAGDDGPGWHYSQGALAGERAFPVLVIDLPISKEPYRVVIR